MANQFATNYPNSATNNVFNTLWKLTRVMKAAGWIYRASSSGAEKDTSGNPANDLWGTNTNPLNDTYSTTNVLSTGSQSLPVGTINTATSPITAGFASSGTINVATSTNGWQSVTYTGTTASSFTGCSGGTGTVPTGSEITTGANMSFEGVIAWWCASGPQTIKLLLNANPTGTPVRGETVTQATSSAVGELFGYVWDPTGGTGWAVIGPQSAPETTNLTSTTALPASTLPVSSTTGFASSGWLQVMTTTGTAIVYYTGTSGGNSFTGCTTLSYAGVSTFGSATSGNAVNVMALPFDGTHVLTGGTSGATLTPLGTTVAVGSNTVNVNTFTNASSGTLNVLSTTGFPAVGTLLVTTGSGTAQITYTGVTGGNAFTGCVTAYTAASTPFSGTLTTGNAVQAAPVVYNREFMFGKPVAGTLTGSTYYVCADPANEYPILYSTLATSTGATAIVWPGGGGTNNGFSITSPVTGTALDICVRGTGNVITGTDGWFASAAQTYSTSSQIAAVNNIAASTVTADGSFYVAATTGVANTMTGIVYTRLDDSEPGDIDPYLWLGSNGTNTYTTYVRTAVTNFNSTSYLWSSGNIFTAGDIIANGYQARGNHAILTRDVPYGFFLTTMYSPVGAEYFQDLSATPVRLVSHPATSAPLVREPLTFCANGTFAGTFRQFKGRARWIVFTSVGNCLDTFDSKTWLGVTAYTVNTLPCVLLGPYDGTTTPTT